MPPRAPVEYRTRDPARVGTPKAPPRRAAACTLMLDPSRPSTISSRSTHATRSRAQRILENAPTGTSPGRSPAPRSTWRWRSCGSTSVAASTWSWSTPPAARRLPRAPTAHPPARQPRLPAAHAAPARWRAWAQSQRRPSWPSRSGGHRGHRRRARLLPRLRGDGGGFRPCQRDTGAAGVGAQRSSSSPPPERRSGEAEFFADRLADGARSRGARGQPGAPATRARCPTCCVTARPSSRRGGGAQRRGDDDALRRLAAQYSNLADLEELAMRGSELHGLERASARHRARARARSRCARLRRARAVAASCDRTDGVVLRTVAHAIGLR